MKNRINRTVFELWTGELIVGVLASSTVFFVNDKGIYLLCLWIGVITAMAASYHMWWAIDRSLEYSESDVPKQMGVQFIYRYLALCLVLGIVGVLLGAYVLGTFVGILGIKLSAYMHFLTKKISTLFYGEEILPPKIMYIDDEEIKESAKEWDDKGGDNDGTGNIAVSRN